MTWIINYSSVLSVILSVFFYGDREIYIFYCQFFTGQGLFPEGILGRIMVLIMDFQFYM